MTWLVTLVSGLVILGQLVISFIFGCFLYKVIKYIYSILLEYLVISLVTRIIWDFSLQKQTKNKQPPLTLLSQYWG